MVLYQNENYYFRCCSYITAFNYLSRYIPNGAHTIVEAIWPMIQNYQRLWRIFIYTMYHFSTYQSLVLALHLFSVSVYYASPSIVYSQSLMVIVRPFPVAVHYDSSLVYSPSSSKPIFTDPLSSPLSFISGNLQPYLFFLYLKYFDDVC